MENTQVAWRISSPVSQGRLAWSPASAAHDDCVAFWMTAHSHANAASRMNIQAMKFTKRERDPTLYVCGMAVLPERTDHEEC